MTRPAPRLLDTFCCSGGAGRGYQLAGFHVTGVDINPQPRYAGDVFVQGDAIEFIKEHGHEFDAIHASPPCQYSAAITKGTNKHRQHLHPDLYPATLAVLESTGRPWVIENPDARPDLVLCGEMFGLGVIRHRRFEVSGFPVWQPAHVKHRGRVTGWRHGVRYDGPYFAVYGDGGGKGTVAEWRTAMGIDWTTDRVELAEAIPPLFARFVGAQLLEHLAVSA